MAANNNLNPEWQPQLLQGEDPLLWTWRKQTQAALYDLRSQSHSLNQTVQSFNNNITQAITKVTQQIAAANNNGNNNSTSKSPAIFGYSGIMWSNYPPNLWSGYFYVQTDRNAIYYSNGSAWVALEGTGTGSFENRWANLNTHDSGLAWVETSRNNISGSPPYPYYQWDGNNWNFISGEFYRNQANLAVLAGTFAAANSNGGNDVGARVNVTDFAGQLQWANNNNWTWGPDDCRMHGMGPIFAEVPPTGNGWHIYDGSNNVQYLLASGNLGSVNLPNLLLGASNNNYSYTNTFVVAGANASGINAPVFPVLVGNLTANTNANGGNSTSANFVNVGVNLAQALTGVNFNFSGGNNNNFGISNNGLPPTLIRPVYFRQ